MPTPSFFDGRRGLVDIHIADAGVDHRESQRHATDNDGPASPAVPQGPGARGSGYTISQWKRKRVEEVLGWLKTIGLLHKARHRGEDRVNWMFVFATAVHNLIRIRKLVEAAA
jgi:hypothetical protein